MTVAANSFISVLSIQYDSPSSVCAVTSLKAGASGLDHDLDRLPLVHRPVAVRHLVEAHDPVEDPAGLDPAIKDVGQKLLDVGADRGGSAAHGDVVVERRLRR